MTMEQQVAQTKQQAAQTGFGGSALLDINPASGIIRMKVKTNSPESLKTFMEQYPQLLVMSLSALNFEVKVHVSEEG